MYSKLGWAVAVVVAGAGVASAHGKWGEGRELPPELVKKLDTNQDGKLDDAERAAGRAQFKAMHEAARAEALATYDANKDGKLDDAEREKMRTERTAARFKEMDKNGDGQLSISEFQAGAAVHGRRWKR